MVAIDPAHLVGTGGAIGAVLRHLVSQWLDVEAFPLGTFTVNILGSFALALATFGGGGSDLLLFVGTGACGSFTTFSTFAFETVRLWETGGRLRGTVNAVGNLVGAALAIGLGWAVASLL